MRRHEDHSPQQIEFAHQPHTKSCNCFTTHLLVSNLPLSLIDGRSQGVDPGPVVSARIAQVVRHLVAAVEVDRMNRNHMGNGIPVSTSRPSCLQDAHCQEQGDAPRSLFTRERPCTAPTTNLCADQAARHTGTARRLHSRPRRRPHRAAAFPHPFTSWRIRR